MVEISCRAVNEAEVVLRVLGEEVRDGDEELLLRE